MRNMLECSDMLKEIVAKLSADKLEKVIQMDLLGFFSLFNLQM
jgi:hypothetical protein